MFPLDVSEKEIMLILKSCEAYGRFALHKEASKDGPPHFSTQMRTLLEWTTDKVIPLLIKQQGSTGAATPFGELNISSISAASASPVQPASPSPMQPRRQRTNRNKTPVRDGSFVSTSNEVNIATANDSTALLSHGVAVSLLQSSCAIFSEWLAVGGSGSDVIAQSVCKWCEIFAASTNKTVLQVELLPAFTRLMIELCKFSDFNVLEKLLVSCDEIESEQDDSNINKKTISSLLTCRDVQGIPLAHGVVTAVLGAASLILQKAGTLANEEDKNQGTPYSLSDVWDMHSGSIYSGLSAVLSNKEASVVLTQKLVDRFRQGVDENDSSKVLLFEAKLLSLICANSTEPQVKTAITTLDASKFSGGETVNEVIRNIVENQIA
jgi:hypothetical protein